MSRADFGSRVAQNPHAGFLHVNVLAPPISVISPQREHPLVVYSSDTTMTSLPSMSALCLSLERNQAARGVGCGQTDD